MKRNHIKMLLLLLLITTACLLCVYHHLDGFWAVFIDASVLLLSIGAAAVAKKYRLYVILSICGMLALLWTVGLILELRTMMSARRELKISLCANGNVLWEDGKIFDYEELAKSIVKDFMRHGVARDVKLSFEPGCPVSNMFKLCEMDANYLLSPSYVLNATVERVALRWLWTCYFGQMPSNDVLMFIIEPGGGMGHLVYRLNLSAFDQLLDLATETSCHKNELRSRSLEDKCPAKLDICSICEVPAIIKTQKVDMVLVVSQIMRLQELCDLLPMIAPMCNHKRCFIMPSFPGVLKWVEKLSTRELEK